MGKAFAGHNGIDPKRVLSNTGSKRASKPRTETCHCLNKPQHTWLRKHSWEKLCPVSPCDDWKGRQKLGCQGMQIFLLLSAWCRLVLCHLVVVACCCCGFWPACKIWGTTWPKPCGPDIPLTPSLLQLAWFLFPYPVPSRSCSLLSSSIPYLLLCHLLSPLLWRAPPAVCRPGSADTIWIFSACLPRFPDMDNLPVAEPDCDTSFTLAAGASIHEPTNILWIFWGACQNATSHWVPPLSF